MWTLKQIVEAMKGSLIQGKASVRIKGISIDSRTLERGQLFIAIKGPRFDGHDFIKDAIEQSASAVVVSQENIFSKKDIPVIRVKDTIKAFGYLARWHRTKFNIPVVAITGSTGKTTTKEMIAAVLKTQYKVLKSEGSQNNHIGVPLTLLKLDKSHDVVVIEFGTNQFGDIRWLTQITQPTVAILTNIGESHLEFFKNLTGVFKEKFDLIKYMRQKGIALFNNDDQYLRQIVTKKMSHELITFGVNNLADYQASRVELKKESWLQFHVNKRQKIRIKTFALHNTYNALIAISCGRLFKIRYNNIKRALAHFVFPDGRQVANKIGHYWVIDDTYNSNPVSLRSAIRTLSQLRIQGRRIFVCSDMLELGKRAKDLHCFIGQLISDSNLDLLLTKGKMSRWIAQTAKKRCKNLIVSHCDSFETLHKKLINYLRPGDAVLVKGSRRMCMERTIAFLRDNKGRIKE